MVRAAMRESTYRFRATFRQRWAGYLTLVVLIGLVGDVALAAVAGARRTQSSFLAYLASTNPSDVQMFAEFALVTGIGYSAKVEAAVARVPRVERAVESSVSTARPRSWATMIRPESPARPHRPWRAAPTAGTPARIGSR